MKKFFLVLICCLIFFSFAGCQIRQREQITVKFDYPFYQSLSDMVTKSDLVVHGKIIGSEFQMLDVGMDANPNDSRRNPGGKTDHTKLPYTIYIVKISEVFKGKAKVGDTVQLKQLGGDDGAKQYVFAEAQPLDAKADYIFFLPVFQNSPASLISPVQGIYTVSGDKIIADEKNPVKIDGFQQLQNLK